ncbi:nuclear transport factor 2 family protein [Saccharothrix obliqua]|uniref:nuclear transport factor 2 family protein n=1 Tax=Saccharothrix obliqua TaxID=2861747 RepID=UPI001C5E81A6|nr:nuclear transport factor 2 family protein [Saccharothrix obliqua]MBW4718314.1 nuclear transport factor 2 family protein [Saccharothrix obliqua]
MSDEPDLATQVKLLAERVRELENVRELNALRHGLPRLINDNAWDRVGELFAEDASLDYGAVGQAEGRAAIADYFAGLPARIDADNPVASGVLVKQFVHGHDVEVLGDRATGVCYFEEKVVFDRESYLVAGKFDDEYTRVDGRWLFSAIKLTTFWVIPYDKGHTR